MAASKVERPEGQSMLLRASSRLPQVAERQPLIEGQKRQLSRVRKRDDAVDLACRKSGDDYRTNTCR